ncbi:hypothetical protein PoB_000745800 [Plakobranchus ocellatus]|uniref:Uncharacterized protein n=1 Tax=Plakobranchus ocellatus TaxID=259542 RepID=A0AAV3YEV2_9GAST|nr:hypothetical protein PoB_000745800 [Plakobranchus ocellatus]
MEKEGTAPDGVSLMITQLSPYVSIYPTSPNVSRTRQSWVTTVDTESSSEIFLRASCAVLVVGRGQFSLQMGNLLSRVRVLAVANAVATPGPNSLRSACCGRV